MRAACQASPLTQTAHLARATARARRERRGARQLTAHPAPLFARRHPPAVLPPAPVHLSAAAQPNGDVALAWVRRSRGGWRWLDGADAPLVEERELYRVTITPAAGAARTVETATPTVIVTAADRAGGAVTVTVRQAGSYGESPAAAIEIPAQEG